MYSFRSISFHFVHFETLLIVYENFETVYIHFLSPGFVLLVSYILFLHMLYIVIFALNSQLSFKETKNEKKYLSYLFTYLTFLMMFIPLCRSTFSSAVIFPLIEDPLLIFLLVQISWQWLFPYFVFLKNTLFNVYLWNLFHRVTNSSFQVHLFTFSF